MKLHQLTEVRYAGSLKAEHVLYTLWKKRNEIEKDNLSVVKINDLDLSKKRASAIARYSIRIIAPEALDAVGRTEEAQKLRDLPPDVDLDHAHDVANTVARAGDAVFYAANAAIAVFSTVDAVANTIAAAYASEITNKHRHLYHLNQMIKLAADIK